MNSVKGAVILEELCKNIFQAFIFQCYQRIDIQVALFCGNRRIDNLVLVYLVAEDVVYFSVENFGCIGIVGKAAADKVNGNIRIIADNLGDNIFTVYGDSAAPTPGLSKGSQL